MEGVKVSTMIDNVRIVARSKEAFVEAVKLFLQRSRAARMALNDEAKMFEAPDGVVASLGELKVSQGYDFLGERYSVKAVEGKRVYFISNTEKLVTKLRDALSYFKTKIPTLRQLAALIGLMLYMAHTLNADLARHHSLLRAYAQFFQGCPEWDEETTSLTQPLWDRIDEMAAVLLANEPVMIQKLSPPGLTVDDFEAVAVFDACQNAWAARVFLKGSTKVLRILKAFASPLRHSAHAEPTAAVELCRWLKKAYPEVKRIALVSDHLALAKGQRRWWSGNGGFSTAFPINEAFKEINGYAQVFHVDGVNNICDEDSRSSLAAAAKTLRVESVQEVFPDMREFVHPFANRPAVRGY